MTEKDRIRRMVLVEGKSIRQAARETRHSRNTVSKMLENSEVPQYRLAEEKEAPVLGPFKALIDKWVAEDEKKPKKTRRTARRMYDVLRQEPYGYTGAASTLRRYVGQARRQVRHKVYLILDYQPGEAAQVDFGESEVTIAGKQLVAQLFLMWLGYSGATFMKAYPAQRQEVFLDGHASAFDFFGGVPHQIWYDNLKVAVLRILKGYGRQEQEAFISFRSHYMFEAHFCNTSAAWEKGGVEGKVGYGRRNWLVPPREFSSWEALNAYLAQQCQAEWARRLRGREERIGQRLVLEQEHFLPLPTFFPCCKTVPVKPNHLSLVAFDSNRYSVPVDHAHERLLLRAFVDRVEITNGLNVLARHPRCWEREQDILDPLHYLSLLARKPRAFAQSKVMRQWRQQWPEAFERYWAMLRQRLPEGEWTKTFVQILKLCEHYPEETLATALDEALRHHCYSYDGVRELLRRQSEPARPAPLALDDRPDLRQVVVQMPDLAQFNRLLPVEPLPSSPSGQALSLPKEGSR